MATISEIKVNVHPDLYICYLLDGACGDQYLNSANTQTDLITAVAEDLDLEQVAYSRIRDVYCTLNGEHDPETEKMIYAWVDKCAQEQTEEGV